MKTVYTSAAESDDASRISMLQNTLSQLRLSNIATLDALMTHFTRLIDLTSADEAYISALATMLAPCILRPKTETSMTMEEKYSYRLVRDLFAHKNDIFAALKRASSLQHSMSVDTRPRAVSTDESNRKANMEARARAIVAAGGSRSRATSPAPASRGHRRVPSSGGPETRFPVAVASPTANEHTRGSRMSGGTVRHSLEVPSESGTPVTSEPVREAPLQSITNGSAQPTITSATFMPGMPDGLDDPGLEKRNSLGRSAAATGGRFASRRPVGRDQGNRDSVGSMGGVESGRGVSLQDRPMSD